MSLHILETVNHTTVEALGFKFAGGYNAGEFEVENYMYQNITVALSSFGGVVVMLDGLEVTINNVDELRQLMRFKKID